MCIRDSETALSGLHKHLFLQAQSHRPKSDVPFLTGMICLAGFYILMILLMVCADLCYTDFQSLRQTLGEPEIQYSIQLSLFSCSLSTLMSLAVAVPIGYLMSRFEFKGQSLVDAVLDIPIVLPPLVVGISLLVLFNYPPFHWLSDWVVFEIPAVVLAQFLSLIHISEPTRPY